MSCLTQVYSAHGDTLVPTAYAANTPYFPGMVVRAVDDSVFASAEWIMGGPQEGRLEGVVEVVETGETIVVWTTQCNAQASNEAPDEVCNPSTLHPLNSFAHTWWNLMDQVGSIGLIGALSTALEHESPPHPRCTISNLNITRRGSTRPRVAQNPGWSKLLACPRLWT